MDSTSDCCIDVVSITAKQGSTFHWAGTINLPSGRWSALSSVVQSGTRRHIGDLTVTLGIPTLDVYPIEVYASGEETLLWNVPKLEADILFIDGSVSPTIIPSPTFTILVDRQITVFPTAP